MAHEPSDIFWENLEISFKRRIRSSVKTYFFTLLAVGISFVAVYEMKRLAEDQDNVNSKKVNLSTTESWKIRMYSIWPSICIIMINFVIGRLIRYFSSFERVHSVTDYNSAVALKLTLAMFINTALVILFVNNS